MRRIPHKTGNQCKCRVIYDIHSFLPNRQHAIRERQYSKICCGAAYNLLIDHCTRHVGRFVGVAARSCCRSARQGFEISFVVELEPVQTSDFRIIVPPPGGTARTVPMPHGVRTCRRHQVCARAPEQARLPARCGRGNDNYQCLRSCGRTAARATYRTNSRRSLTRAAFGKSCSARHGASGPLNARPLHMTSATRCPA